MAQMELYKELLLGLGKDLVLQTGLQREFL